MKTKQLWAIVCAAALALLLGVEALMISQLLKLSVLPRQYVWLVLAVLALLPLLAGLLMFVKRKNKENSPGVLRRAAACLLALIMAVGCLEVASALKKVQNTMDEVTENTVISDVIGVYVLAEDSAANLSDLAGYTVAVTIAYDWENTQSVLGVMEKEIGGSVDELRCDHVFGMIEALYSGEAKALILNQAYLSILEELEPYRDFGEKTKVVYEHLVKETVVLEKETEASTKAPVQDEETAGSGEDEVPGTETEPETKPEEKRDPSAFVLYLSGSDTRSAILKTSRSDVNILGVVNCATGQVLLVNTPRDYYIPNPAGGGALDKLTHCGIYGVDCSVQALEDLYDVEVDYYAQINFAGFETLIDAIGGVTIYSEKGFKSSHGPFYVEEGYNEFDGFQAVCYARERYAFKDGDHARGRNQMKLIKAILEKLSAGTIITRYSEILDSMTGTFVTSMPQETITDLIKNQLTNQTQWEIFSYAVVGTGASSTSFSSPTHSSYVMIPAMDTVEQGIELIDRVLAGERITQEELKR